MKDKRAINKNGAFVRAEYIAVEVKRIASKKDRGEVEINVFVWEYRSSLEEKYFEIWK